MAEQMVVDKRYLTLFEKCQLAYSYEKLVGGVKNKASLCRQIGIDWDTYYHARRIIEIQFDQREYKEKADDLKQRLCQQDPRGTPEKNRIVYASKKLKSWEKEIKQVVRIPQTVRYFHSRGYSNMFIELTVKKHIPQKSTSFGPFSLLGQCLCCGSRLCECEPNQYIGRPHSMDWYTQLLHEETTEWLNGNEQSEKEFADKVNTIRLEAMVGGWGKMCKRLRSLE